MTKYIFDAFRFSYFSRAALDYIVKSGKQPDVIHFHNWETAIVGPLFWDIFAKQVQLIIVLLNMHSSFSAIYSSLFFFELFESREYHVDTVACALYMEENY